MSGPVSPPLRVQTENGTVSGRPINTIKVTNGTLTISGSTASVVTGAGGGGGSGTVTSVGLTQTGSALDITGSPVTASGTIDIAGAGNSSQVILGDLSLGTLTSGTVTGVTGTAPISSSGGTAPAISITQSDATTNGYLSSTDWNTFNDKGSGTITGSATNTQVSYGAATANEITSNANLTFDGTNLSVGGYVEVGTKVTTPSGDNLELIPGGTSSGSIVIADGLDGQISLNPSGTGTVKLDGVELDNSNIATGYVLKASSTTVAGWAAESGGGGSGTVTSITPDADTGTGTAITTSGTLSFYGGTNITTSVTGTAVTINSSAGGSPAGSNTEVQFNNSGAFGASSILTFDGTYLSPNLVKLADGGNAGSFPYAIGFASDDDTGLYRSAANELTFSAGGTQVITIGGFTKRLLLGAHTGTTATSLSTYGAQDIVISTNQTTDSGTITITNGVNGDISLTPNGTGAVEISGAYKLPIAVPTANGQVLTGQTDGSTAWAASGGGGGIGGSGTIATVPVFVTDTTTLGDSRLVQSGSTEMIYSASSGAAFTVKSNDGNEPNFKMLTSSSTGLRFELTNADSITLKKVGTNTLRFRSDGTAFTIFNNTSSTDGIFSATYSTGAIKINNAYTLPTAVPTANGQVLTGQTDGSTAWATSGGGVTFPLEGSDGTKTVPTYSFSNATNMGMYKASGMVALRLAVGGSDVLEIQKDGAATEFRVGDGGEARITSNGSYDLLLQTDNGSNSGTIKINQGANSNIDITPNGDGYILLDNLKWPIADGTNGQVLTTDGTGGLTFQSGGSSSDYGVFFGSDQSYFQASYDQWQISNMVPFQVIGENATNIATQYSQAYKPFIAPKTGEVTELIIRIATLNGSALNGFVSIYNSNSDGMPSTLIGYATFDLNSATGEISQNTFSTAINLTKGSGYYLSWSDSQGSAVARTYRVQTHKPGTDNATSHFTYCNQVDNLNSEFIVNFSTSTTPDSPAGTSNYNSSAYGFPTINMVM